MALESEMETYREVLPKLLANVIDWVVIKGSVVAGIRKTWEEATDLGYELFELEAFMVRRIQRKEPYLLCQPRYILVDPN